MKLNSIIIPLFVLTLIVVIAGCTHEQPPTEVTTEGVIGIGPLPPCPAGVTGTWRYVENDSVGTIIEIRCVSGQYRMNFTTANGTSGYIGKCPYDFGQNGVAKKVNITIINESGTLRVRENTIEKTFWRSFDAPNRSQTVTGINRRDIFWQFYVKNNTLVEQNTTHNGTWVFVNGNWTYNVTGTRKEGNATNKTPPSGPGGLYSYAATPRSPSGDEGFCAIKVPEFKLRTPVPATIINKAGIAETYVYKIPVGTDKVMAEKIEATAGKTFTFDIDMPGEDIGMVRYSLARGPEGMKLDSATGVINWETGTEQANKQYPVAIKIEYPDATFTDEFVLRVGK